MYKLILTCYNFVKMPERRNWNEEEDRVLRFLKQQRKETKWSVIASLMQSEFNIMGRTGKQCRERYQNHLDSNINMADWTPEQEQILYQLHDQYGNKWSLIAKKIVGRSDNCVKNHFYSKLRKAIRKINKLVKENQKSDFKEIKNQVLYKILQAAQSKFKISSKVDEYLESFCSDIKNRLFLFNVEDKILSENQLFEAQRLYDDISEFSKNRKKTSKLQKYMLCQPCDDSLLHPKSCLKFRKNSSDRSISDSNSDYSQILSSSSQGFSEGSYDCSDFQPEKSQKSQKSEQSEVQIKIEFQESSTKIRDSLTKKTNIQTHSFQYDKCNFNQLGTPPQIRLTSRSMSSNRDKALVEQNDIKSEDNNRRQQFQMEKIHIENQIIKQECQKLQASVQKPLHFEKNAIEMDEEINDDYIINMEHQSPKCTFFDDVKLEMRIISPKVSSGSQKSFEHDYSKDFYF